MAIPKQAFYEGAALYLVARGGDVTSIQYQAPFFLLNKKILVMMKYSTRGRSPWGFTFTAEEQVLLRKRITGRDIMLALVCGADGVVTLSLEAFLEVAPLRKSAIHISCYRDHNEHYEVNGPNGVLGTKIPPSMWQRILQV